MLLQGRKVFFKEDSCEALFLLSDTFFRARKFQLANFA